MLKDNVKRFRKEKNLSQEELAKEAGITYTTLAKIESGNNTNPTVKTIQKIAQALDVTIDDLMKE
jgi:transcriptional regulator with XRE-family HTH domain